MIVPVELSVNATVKGTEPIVGLPVKSATVTAAPVPISALVLLPPPLVIVTRLLKVPEVMGVNRIVRFDAPNPGSVKEVPDKMVKGPPETAATPLLKVAVPALVNVKLSCAFVPTRTVPKLRFGGETRNCAGDSAEPKRLLVLLPPLLVITTTSG